MALVSAAQSSAYCLLLSVEHERKRNDHLLSSSMAKEVRCRNCLFMFWKAVGCSKIGRRAWAGLALDRMKDQA